MTKVIGDYTAAATIDGSTHYLLIQPGSASTAYKKINRNVFLGITGQPADISSSQNMTNKTLDNTNTVTLKDTLFTLQDDSDMTKQAKFQLSGITTATTRTYTLPNTSSTLVDLSTSQTLTNKTLTAPVITNGSITGTTITTDAIVGQVVATSGTIYGMSISSAKVGSNGVVTASITDSAVTPAKLLAGTGSTWTWQSWTPTLTNITLGNGIFSGVYTQIGKLICFQVNFTVGSSTTVGTNPVFTLPVVPSLSSFSPFYGGCTIIDSSASTSYFGGATQTNGATTVSLFVYNTASTYATQASITSTAPMTWAAGDTLSCIGTYRAA